MTPVQPLRAVAAMGVAVVAVLLITGAWTWPLGWPLAQSGLAALVGAVPGMLLIHWADHVAQGAGAPLR